MSQALRDEREAFRQRLADRDAEIDRFRNILTSVRDLSDGDLDSPDGQS